MSKAFFHKPLTAHKTLITMMLAGTILSLPSMAAAKSNNAKCSNTGDVLIGGLLGGSLGTIIGKEVAGRGDKTEGAIVGALLGGVGGALIGDSSEKCKKTKKTYNETYQPTYYSNGGHYNNTGYQPANYVSQNYTGQNYTGQNYTGQNYTGQNYNTVYAPNTYSQSQYTTLTTYTPQPAINAYSHTGHTHNSHAHSNQSYTHYDPYEDQSKSLPAINRKIKNLKRIKEDLKCQRQHTPYYDPELEAQIDQIKHRISKLKKRRKYLEAHAQPYQRHGNYGQHISAQRPYQVVTTTQVSSYQSPYVNSHGHYHSPSTKLCYRKH